MITVEALKGRIEDYETEQHSIREQLEKIRREAEGKLNALQGAIDDCNHWLSQLHDEESNDG